MNDLSEKYTDLARHYGTVFEGGHLNIENIINIDDLLRRLPKAPGVYIIKKGEEIIYIGSAGKFKKGKCWGNGVLSGRGSRWAPYFFNDIDDKFYFCPNHEPERQKKERYNKNAYRCSHLVSELKIECFVFSKECHLAPSVLEHILIQGHINEYDDLPPANKEI